MSFHFRKVKIGFVNLSLDFLEEDDLKMANKYAEDAKKFLEEDLNVLIDEYSKPVNNIVQSREVWKQFKSSDVDAIIIFNGTFSTGEVTVELVRNISVPYLVWGIEEFAIAKHNFTGSMVGTLPQGTIFKNLGKKFSFAYGNISRESTKNKLKKFISAVRGIAYLKEATIGVVGMRPDGFEISDFDELAVKNMFGTTITKVSMYGFSKIIQSITEEEIDADMEIQKKIFNIPKDQIIPSRGLSKVYLAIKKVSQEKNLQSYAPDCWPELRDMDQTPICPANGRLNTEGVMASCECDVDGSLSLMMAYAIAQTTPWFADFVNLIEEEDAILFWHCGNAPYNLSDQPPKIEKVFGGPSQTAILKKGIATVVRINSIRGTYSIHAGVGEVIEGKSYLKGSNLFIKMHGGNMEFVESLLYNGIPHHNAIVYGDILDEIKEFANLMDIPIVTV